MQALDARLDAGGLGGRGGRGRGRLSLLRLRHFGLGLGCVAGNRASSGRDTLTEQHRKEAVRAFFGEKREDSVII
jgi:hypothetical protein